MVISTGVGSMPGTDVLEAIATVTGEFPDLVHLPELPQRGPGADMIGRTAALLAKGASGRAEAWPAPQVLRALTLDGARALGLDASIGSIEPGKEADLVAFDLGASELQPVYDPLSQLIYAAGHEHVAEVWIAGQHVVKMRQLGSADAVRAVREVVARVPVWQNQVVSA